MTALTEALLQIAGAAVLMLGSFVLLRLRQFLRLRADAEVRGYLTAALDRAVEFGLAEARRRVTGPDLPVRAVVAAEVARDYVQRRVPDALAHFGIETTDLDQMIRARMPKPAGSTAFHG
jgi:glycerol-3-phosphate O-acyltransferase